MISLPAWQLPASPLDNACHRAGFRPRVTAETSHLALLFELVAGGHRDDHRAPLRPALTRLRALAILGEMADRGDFDEFLGDKATCRR